MQTATSKLTLLTVVGVGVTFTCFPCVFLTNIGKMKMKYCWKISKLECSHPHEISRSSGGLKYRGDIQILWTLIFVPKMNKWRVLSHGGVRVCLLNILTCWIFSVLNPWAALPLWRIPDAKPWIKNINAAFFLKTYNQQPHQWRAVQGLPLICGKSQKIPSVVICGYCGNLAIRGFKHPSGLRQKKHKLLELMDIAMSDFAYFLHFLKKFEP